ncbi:histone-lysine N-methyltransferase eggless isoform X2 [Nymphalis io]|uniref:histone-lysine N-methyltransferase eggless isoform X2 n=1 Tax=Inachis io TaxID=171585 RepID=UPI002169F907|nr:histone-lysine N-methyltransferase eggless isoform X2 [Nymphalis io]
MDSTENTEVSDKDDGEMASIQLIEKETINSSDVDELNTTVLNEELITKGTVKDDENTRSSIEKNVEEILLGDGNTQNLDSDNVDEEMELRWDDDELDEVDEIRNEATLLEEDLLDSPKPCTLSLQDEVIKTIEAEENLLNLDNDNESKESPPDSIKERLFAPNNDHNLNKPDIMLEIPSHEVIEFSDDEEDLINNLEMSPDLESDEEMCNSTEVPIESTQADVHADDEQGEGDVLEVEKDLTNIEPIETMNKALENEAKFAADILTKELNVMHSVPIITTDTNTEMNEEFLLKEDSMQDDCLLKDGTIEDDCLLEEYTTIQEGIIENVNSLNGESDIIKLKDPTEESLKKQDNLDATNTIANESEPREDTQSVDEEMTDLYEDILLATSDNSTDAKESVPDLEDTTILKSESSIDVAINIKETDTPKTEFHTSVTEDKMTDTIENDSSSEANIVTESLDADITIISSNEDNETDTDFIDTIPTIQQSEKEEESILDKLITNTAKKNTDVQASTSTAYIDTHKEEIPSNTDIKEITNDEVPKDLQSGLSRQDEHTLEYPLSTSTLDLKGDEAKSLVSSVYEKTFANVSIDLHLPAHPMDIDQPQPSTSFACLKTSKSPDEQSSMFGSSMVKDKDVPEMTDSLGLLAECKMMEEDEEQEYDDDGDGEDEDDFDQDDESSNQMTAEHSEDSNAQHSESEVQKEMQIDFQIDNVVSEDAETENKEYTDTKPEQQETTGKDVEIKLQNDDNKSNIETVKLSDTSDTEIDSETIETNILKTLLLTKNDTLMSDKVVEEKQSPSKSKNLEIVKQDTILSFVDLEESSSEDDMKEVKDESSKVIHEDENATKVDESDNTSAATKVKSEALDSTLKTSPTKSVTQDTKTADGSTDVIEESKPKVSIGLEVFNLDSDDEEENVPEEASQDIPHVQTQDVKDEMTSEPLKCINRCCPGDSGVEFYIADSEAINFYDADRKRRGYVCQNCADAVEKRNQELIDGIKNFTPLLELGINKSGEELVEISDSESEDEPELDQDQMQIIGVEGAKKAEENLASLINETWEKYKMDARLADTQDALEKEIEKLQKESEEINEILNECQVATDQLRNELYATFEPDIRELSPFVIYDMPNCSHVTMKRTRSPTNEIPAKRPAIPLGYAPLNEKNKEDSKNMIVTSEKAEDDNTDVSVVKLSAESAPKDLPPPGEITMPPVKAGMTVYAMKNAFGSWLKAKIVDILPKPPNSTFTLCRVKFEHKVTKNMYKILPARCLAYYEPPDVRMTIGRRVIALFKDTNKRETYYSGVVAEIPNPVNSYRYLIFFDDGYAQYAQHAQTRLVCECSCFVWEEVHPYSRDFVRQYLFAYPERPMVRLHAGQKLKTEWRGKWWSSSVVRVDASLVEVQFLRRDRREWIYRGSTRLAPLYLELQAAERHRPRAVPRAQPQARMNMPYVEYTRSDEQTNKAGDAQTQLQRAQIQNEELRRQRAVAKKSTAAPAPPPAGANLDSVASRVVFYTPKSAVKPYKMVPHTCSPKCKRTDVLDLKDLRTYNPLTKPLLSGWERQVVRWKGGRSVLYVAPCGRRTRDVRELHAYLRAVRSDMAVDLFDFSPSTHCLAEFVLNSCFVGKKDLSHGKENVPVPCVNYYDDSLPEFCSYNTERTPTAGVPLNLDPDFLCGCDCDDDCEDKTKCACWKMTLEGARTIGLEGDNVGYVYKRLPEPLPSGIYECNSRCKCKHTCLNRVAQHPLQLKLQVFKTLNRGWGIRTLNDVPKGSFLCVYAGNLLTDATANLDGLNEGDEYLAELDYIEVVEQMKEGYEEDIPEHIKKLDKKELESKASEETEEEEQSSDEEMSNNKTDLEDDDFEPGHIGLGLAEFNKRLRKRESKKEKNNEKIKEEENQKEVDKKEIKEETNPDEDCITISDDEEVREPSCFTAAAGMGANEFISKYRSVRRLFGEDEACYIMDAKVQGNIGRYLNHSCSPNVFVQNVFVDTHDPRFPWVAFFALSHIKAGTELTWNYNYDVGSVPGKVLYCHCGASNCRGRLL